MVGNPDVPRPEVSIVVVADYAAGGAKATDDMRGTLAALAQQDFEGPVEFLLCEDATLDKDIPAEFTRILPTLRVVLAEASSSYELKNAGVQAASADVIAILDADCVPEPDWLSNLMTAMRANPGAAVISGRTVYAGRGLGERVLALLSRSYLDPGKAGVTRFIANNNAAWRRSVYLAHPMPVGLGPFASRIQSESVLRAGGQLLFEPTMRVVHDFEGWPMEVDIRRNIGYGTVVTRLRDRSLPYAWLAQIGVASIPAFAVGKTLNSWWDCLRCAPAYGVRWHEVPLALMCSVIVHAMEIPGMWQAFRGKTIAETTYR